MLPSTIITLVWKGPRHNFVDPHGKLLETNDFQIRSIFASSNFHTHLNILVSANFNFQKYSPSYIYSQRCMHVCMVHMCIAVCMWKRDARTERASAFGYCACLIFDITFFTMSFHRLFNKCGALGWADGQCAWMLSWLIFGASLSCPAAATRCSHVRS